jgi:hypothetical protein
VPVQPDRQRREVHGSGADHPRRRTRPCWHGHLPGRRHRQSA